MDALFEKHKTWVERENHLKNRIIELENTITELRNKLEETMNETQVEEMAEYNEQITQIYQGF